MPSARIDFSAQFGGQDAASAVLPHFHLLKAASRGLRIEGFPFPELAYILRVDGDVAEYSLSGAGNLEIDRSGNYLSIDIGVKRADRDRICEVVSAAILSSPKIIFLQQKKKGITLNVQSMAESLKKLVERYQIALEQT